MSHLVVRTHCRYLLVLACASAACSTLGSSVITGPNSLRSVKIPFQTVMLDNGLQVILNEDHRVPVVAVDVIYGVGWSDDPPGKPSLAHYFEHLMFQGSAHVAANAHFEYLESAGAARIGGRTEPDITEYFETVPANQLELALWLESDRMGFMQDSLDSQKIERVRAVVDNEYRQRRDNATIGRALEFMFSAVFPQGHPYHGARKRPTDEETITLNDLQQLGRTYYIPNNASLALSGDFEPATAVALIDHYFGSLPPGPKPIRPPTRSISPVRPTLLHIAAAVEREQLLLAWPTPAVGQPDDAELDVAAFTLNTAFLRRVLIEETPVAVSARAHHFSGLQGGMFFIAIDLRPGWTAEAALQTVDKQLRLLRDFRVRQSWSLFASQSVLKEVLEGAQTTAGRAEKLNRYGVLMHNPGYLADEVARFDQIVPADVLDAIWRYLPDDNRVVALVHADRSAPVGGRLVEKP